MLNSLNHPRYLIFYATSECNLRCSHCFYIDNLGACDELTLPEIRRVARSIRSLRFLRITGGEPFLRSDLPNVVETFARESGVRRLGIITNGTLPERTSSMVKEILQRSPSLRLDVGVSVDGLRATHDRLRGREGLFDKCRVTVQNLLSMKRRLPSLSVSVVVTVSAANEQELDALFEEVSGWGPVRISPNLVRGRLKEPSLTSFDIARYEHFCERCEEHHRDVDRRFQSIVRRAKNRLAGEAIRSVVVGERSPVRCLAGISICVLYPDGTVSVCEPLYHAERTSPGNIGPDPILGNVRDVGGDLRLLWRSEKATRIREWIKRSRCSCTHECFLTASILWGKRNYPALLRESVRELLSS